MDNQRKACVMVRMAGPGLVFMVLFGWLAGCASNPPARPMPQPATPRAQAEQPERSTSTPERQVASGATAQPEPAREAPTQATEPDWYRQDAFDVEGREHRAFSVTAGDVREARSRAMLLAYEAYPDGNIAAHEAIRQADGSWRFYVLMASGG